MQCSKAFDITIAGNQPPPFGTCLNFAAQTWEGIDLSGGAAWVFGGDNIDITVTGLGHAEARSHLSMPQILDNLTINLRIVMSGDFLFYPGTITVGYNLAMAGPVFATIDTTTLNVGINDVQVVITGVAPPFSASLDIDYDIGGIGGSVGMNVTLSCVDNCFHSPIENEHANCVSPAVGCGAYGYLPASAVVSKVSQAEATNEAIAASAALAVSHLGDTGNCCSGASGVTTAHTTMGFTGPTHGTHTANISGDASGGNFLVSWDAVTGENIDPNTQDTVQWQNEFCNPSQSLGMGTINVDYTVTIYDITGGGADCVPFGFRGAIITLNIGIQSYTGACTESHEFATYDDSLRWNDGCDSIPGMPHVINGSFHVTAPVNPGRNIIFLRVFLQWNSPFGINTPGTNSISGTFTFS